MNLKTLTEQRADKQTEMETLLNKVEGEKRAFTEGHHIMCGVLKCQH